MKRFFVGILFTLVLIMMTSCGTPEQRVEKYVKENKMLGAASGYVYCENELEARGTDVVLRFILRNDISENDTADIINELREMLDGEFEEMFKTMKSEEPAVTALILEFCDYEGNVVMGYVYK